MKKKDYLMKYLKLGWYLLPLKPNSKVPVTRRGVYDATNDFDKVMAIADKYPDFNWAVANGQSGIFVIDVDNKEGDGLERLALIESSHNSVGRTRLVSYTPNGGYHLYLKMPSTALPCTVGRIAKGIDTRGFGGYTVLPPSRIEDSLYGEYIWLDDDDLDAQIPVVAQWVVDMLIKPSTERLSRPVKDLDGSAQRIANWLMTAPEGERNSRLFWAACEYSRIGVSLEQAKDALGKVAAHIGLPEREAMATIQSAYKR